MLSEGAIVIPLTPVYSISSSGIRRVVEHEAAMSTAMTAVKTNRYFSMRFIDSFVF